MFEKSEMMNKRFKSKKYMDSFQVVVYWFARDQNVYFSYLKP